MLRAISCTAAVVLTLAAWPAASQAVTIVGDTAYGLAPATDEIVMFDTSDAGHFIEHHPFTGLGAGEHIRAIDFRPGYEQLYGLGVNSGGATDSLRLYKIDPGTGAATAVGAAMPIAPPKNSVYGFDFDPTDDTIRIVTDSDLNYRVNPQTAVVQTDTTVDDPANNNEAVDEEIVSLAYDDNHYGAVHSTLYGYDYRNDRIVRIGDPDGTPAPANSGVIHDVGSSNITSGTKTLGMDIAPNGAAYITSNTFSAPGTYSLYALSLATGGATKIGDFPVQVTDIALPKDYPMSLSTDTYVVDESAGMATVHIYRGGELPYTQHVSYTTTDGSAKAGSDYTATSGTATFSPLAGEATFQVPITNDGDNEPNEDLTVSLVPDGQHFTNPAEARILILDDDAPAVVVPPDKAAPKLLLAAPTSLPLRKLKSGLSGSFSCSEACSADFGLKLGKSTLGTGAAALTSGDVGKFKIALSNKKLAAVRRKLKKHKTVRLKLVAAAADAANNTSGAIARVTVTRR